MEGGNSSSLWPGHFGSRKKGPQRGCKDLPVSCGYLMALFPAWANLNDVTDVAAARRHFGVQDAVWDAWVAQVGDPGMDLRLLAALPRTALQGGCQTAILPGGQGFTAIQATQVGLLWRLARRVVAFRAGISVDEFQDDDPWDPEQRWQMEVRILEYLQL